MHRDHLGYCTLYPKQVYDESGMYIQRYGTMLMMFMIDYCSRFQIYVNAFGKVFANMFNMELQA